MSGAIKCPECGHDGSDRAAGGIYARADIRWDAVAGRWEVTHIEDEIECTACDALFFLDEIGEGLPEPAEALA